MTALTMQVKSRNGEEYFASLKGILFLYSTDKLTDQSSIAVCSEWKCGQGRARKQLALSRRPRPEPRCMPRARSPTIRTLHLDMIRKTGIDEASAERKRGTVSCGGAELSPPVAPPKNAGIDQASNEEGPVSRAHRRTSSRQNRAAPSRLPRTLYRGAIVAGGCSRLGYRGNGRPA